MSLTLEVTGPEGRRLGAAGRKVFSGTGGTIGRLPENDWVLSDEYVSGRHARIQYANGAYYVVDTSSNGTFLNSPDNRLPKNQPQPLNDGDRLFIDTFEIRVTVTAEAAAPAPAPRRAPPPPPAGDSPLAGMFDAVPMDAPAPSAGPAPRGGLAIPADPFDDGNDPFGSASTGARAMPRAAPTAGSRAEPLIPEDPFGENAEADPLAALGLAGKPAPAAPVPRADQLLRGDPLRESYRPPAPVAPPPPAAPPPAPSSGGGMIPDDYDPLSGEEPARPAARPPPPPPAAAPRPPPRPAPPPARPPPPRPAAPVESVWNKSAAPAEPPPPPAPVRDPRTATQAPPRPSAAPRPPPAARPPPPPAASAPPPAPSRAAPPASPAAPADFAALLAAAGVEGATVTPELMQDFGRILRVVVVGIMDLLRAREKIKDEFRMRMTTFKAADNNPLKFSVNVEDALHNLLVKHNAAYLKPVAAFEDAFQDARNHQVAMLAGLRVAFEAMLAEFDPDRLQENFDRQVKKGGILSGPARLKYWELYRERYQETVKDADTAFRELFGEEFAKAYEAQMQRLKTSDRAQDRS